jgi:hypothetical protein
MTTTFLSRTVGGSLIGLLIFAGLASASTITATGVDWSRGGSIWINEDGTSKNAYFAGVVLITLSENGQQYSRDTLCVDLFTDIYIGVTYNTTVIDPSAVPGRHLSQVAWLLNNALMPTQGPVYSSALPSSDWVTTASQGSGIQLAIWDITADGGDGFSSGRVQASTTPGALTDPAVLAWAQTYESLSASKTSNQAFVYVNSAIGSGTPAQMLEGPVFRDGGPTPPGMEAAGIEATPEPATCLLAGLALVGLGVFKRRGGTSSR